MMTLWDKQVRQDTIDLDFLFDGGIYMEQMYALGCLLYTI